MHLKHPKAEIIAIGSEFLHGGRLESNSIFLAEGLGQCGVEVYWKTLVGDDLNHIASVLRTALRRANIVILTGGLGSTIDDCTREAVAKVTGCTLRRRPKALTALTTCYASKGRTITSVLARQAYLPSGATMLDNPVGSAPGFLLERKRSLLIALPGVSREAEAMFRIQVIPRLATRVSNPFVLSQRVISTVGLTEVEIDRCLAPIIEAESSLQVSLLASTQGVAVVLREWSAAKTGHGEYGRMKDCLPKIRRLLGDAIYTEDKKSMEEVVGQMLISASETVTLAESCTGGLIGHRLTQVPGSSSYLDRSFVCYSNQAKQELLGVPRSMIRRYGAVSAQVAKAMAIGARQQGQTDIGVSVTGIAGPGGGSANKPVGRVFLGIDGSYGTTTQKLRFFGNRSEIKMRASQAALNMLRLYLLSHLKK